MCIVSAITTYPEPVFPSYPEPVFPSFPDPWYQPTDKYKLVPPWYEIVTVIKYPKGQFANWSYNQCEAYIELLEKAQAYDKIANEPHCSDPEKTFSLTNLRERICIIGLEDELRTENCLKLASRLDTIIKAL